MNPDKLRIDAVDSGNVRVGDERDRTVTRDELAQTAQRSALDVDARSREHGVVVVAHDRVGGIGVERPSLLVQALEVVVVLRERTIAAADTRPAGLDVGVEP